MRTRLFEKAAYLLKTKQIKIAFEDEYAMGFQVGKYSVIAKYRNQRLLWICDCMAGSQENLCAHKIAAQTYLISRVEESGVLAQTIVSSQGNIFPNEQGTHQEIAGSNPASANSQQDVRQEATGDSTDGNPGLLHLTERQKLILREMVEFRCEDCHRHEDNCGRLEPHRIIRGADGGRYIPRNIKMICAECHDNYAYEERYLPGLRKMEAIDKT